MKDEVMDLKESMEGIGLGLEKGKGRRNCCNYNIKNKKELLVLLFGEC